MKAEPVSVVIPAAGVSDRMGSDKALLQLPGGISFANHLLSRYRTYGAEPVILIVNDNLDLSEIKTESCIIVVNHQPDRGRSWSVKLGMDRVPAGYGCFIHNIDNPYAAPALLETLHLASGRDSYVVPVYEGKGGHPVLLGSDMVNLIRSWDEPADFRELLKRFPRVEIPCTDGNILWNINTPGDYERFMKSQPPSELP